MPFPLGGGPGFAHDGAGWERPRPVSLPGHSLASARLPGRAAMGSPWLCALGTPGGQTVPPGVGAPPGAEVVKVAGPQLRAPARGGLLPWAGPVAVTAEAAWTRARGRALRSACVVAAGVPRGPSGDRAGSLGTPCDLTGPRARPVRAQWHLLQASVSCCPSWSGHLRTSWAWELMCLDAVGDPQQPPGPRPASPSCKLGPLRPAPSPPPVPPCLCTREAPPALSSPAPILSSATSDPHFYPFIGVSFSMIVALLPEVLFGRFSD